MGDAVAVHHVLTVPSEVPGHLADALLTAVEQALLRAGATRIWIDPTVVPDAVVMAELPEPPVAAPDDPASYDEPGLQAE